MLLNQFLDGTLLALLGEPLDFREEVLDAFDVLLHKTLVVPLGMLHNPPLQLADMLLNQFLDGTLLALLGEPLDFREEVLDAFDVLLHKVVNGGNKLV